jgi:hypothetical protein
LERDFVLLWLGSSARAFDEIGGDGAEFVSLWVAFDVIRFRAEMRLLQSAFDFRGDGVWVALFLGRFSGRRTVVATAFEIALLFVELRVKLPEEGPRGRRFGSRHWREEREDEKNDDRAEAARI